MRMLASVIFQLLLAVTSSARAIECHIARSAIEKRICKSEELMNLDSSLNAVYWSVVAAVDNPEKLRRDQIGWLSQVRAKCDSDHCLVKVHKDRIIVLDAILKSRWKLYSDKEFGIEFSYPRNRSVIKNDNDFYLTEFHASEKHNYIIHFRVGDGDFESANAKEFIFGKRDGRWFSVMGRFNNSPAELISGDGWSGVFTTIICGISDEDTGFHAAGGECLYALLSDGERYVLAETEGVLGLDLETEKSLRSLKFLRRP